MNTNISTIRLTPDGFSLYNATDGRTSYDVAPGPDFGQRMQESILEHLPVADTQEGLVCEVETTRLLLLPPEISHPDVQQQMYDVTFSATPEEEQLLTQTFTLPTGQAVQLCFGLNRSLYHFLQRNYEMVSFSHPIVSLLEEGARMAQGNCLVVRCDERYLELALFRDKQLYLCNSYHTTQAENRTYYVMNTWQQLGLDQLSDYLLVLGGTNEGLQVRASTHRFIKHVFS